MEEKKEFLVTVYIRDTRIKLCNEMRVFTNDPEIARKDGFDVAIQQTPWNTGNEWTREKQEQCFDVLVWEA